jgi:hypothetical protein
LIKREEKEWLAWREEYEETKNGEQRLISQYCNTIEAELEYLDEHGLHAKFLEERGMPPSPQRTRGKRGQEIWSPDKERQQKKNKKAAISLTHLVAARMRHERCVRVCFGRDRI